MTHTIHSKVTGVKLVKFDVEEEVPKRGSDGFCIECAAGESGEMLAPILPGKISTQFQVGGWVGLKIEGETWREQLPLTLA